MSMRREKPSRVLPKRESPEMVSAADTVGEAQFKLRELARPMWSGTREASLTNVARNLGLTPTQAKRIAYRELKRIDAHVLENIRIAYARLEARAERMADAEEQIQRALRREIEGRDNAASAEIQGGDVAAARKPART